MASSIDLLELTIAKLTVIITGIKENMATNEIEIKLVQADRVFSKAISSLKKEGVTAPCKWPKNCDKLIQGDSEINGACTHSHMKGEREEALKFKSKKFMKPNKSDDDEHAAEPKPNKSDDGEHAAESKPKNKSKEKTVDCIYFAKGECKKGDKCTFIHDEKKLFVKTKKTDDDDSKPKSKKPTGKTYARAAAGGGGGAAVLEELNSDSE